MKNKKQIERRIDLLLKWWKKDREMEGSKHLGYAVFVWQIEALRWVLEI